MTKAIERGGLQARVAAQMVKFKITAKSKPETKTKAVTAAQKALGDKEPLRARQIMNWMLRHEYKPSDIAKRVREQNPTRRKSAKKATTRKASKPASAATQAAA